MTFIHYHYVAEVKAGRILELPIEAEQLHLKPGEKVPVQLSYTDAPSTIATQSALGKYAFVSGGSKTFASEKQKEIKRENRH